MQEEFGLHDLAIEDALSAHQRPKVERYDNSLFVVLRTAQIDDPKPEEAVRRAIRRSAHVPRPQFHRHGAAWIRHFLLAGAFTSRSRRRSCSSKVRRSCCTPSWTSSWINTFRLSTRWGKSSSRSKQRVFTQPFSRRTTTQIYKLKRDLISLKRVVAPVIELAARLIRLDDEDLIPTQVRPYFRDVDDYTLRINDMIDGVRDLLGTALEAHLSLVSVSQNEIRAGWPHGPPFSPCQRPLPASTA